MSSMGYSALREQSFPIPLWRIGRLWAADRNKAWTRVGQTIEDKVRQAQAGDKQAYAEAIREMVPMLNHFLSPRLNRQDVAEDVLQDILLSIHRSLHTYDGNRPFRPWVMAIAQFRLKDHLRKHYRNREVGVSDEATLEALAGGTPATESDDETFDRLDGALSELPDKHRRIVTMMKLEGRSVKETAESLDMKEGAVKVTAHRAYKMLKMRLLNKVKRDI